MSFGTSEAHGHSPRGGRVERDADAVQVARHHRSRRVGPPGGDVVDELAQVLQAPAAHAEILGGALARESKHVGQVTEDLGQDAVLGCRGQALVEVHVGLREAVGIVEVVAQRTDETVQFSYVGVVAAQRGLLGGQRLELAAHTHQVDQIDGCDERARPAPLLEQTQVDEATHGLAQRGAGDRQGGRQVALGGDLGAGRTAAGQEVLPQARLREVALRHGGSIVARPQWSDHYAEVARMLGTAMNDGVRRMVVGQGDALELSRFTGDLTDWLAQGMPLAGHESSGERVAEATLVAPVLPGKIIAIGLNYRDHIAEAGMDTPAEPLIFTKLISSVIGPGDEIELPAIADARVDWEVELGVVIGRRMRNVAADDALEHVLGYTVVNDVSARAVQFGDGQWVRGKSFDTFCPMGPLVATTDEIEDPQALELRCWVNDVLMQDSTTAQMLFSVAEILAYCSRWFTLEPGDVVITGTPWGCGEFMSPPVSLVEGDVVRTEIAGLGTLSNPVVGAGAARPVDTGHVIGSA